MAEKKISNTDKKILTGISPKAWEHPADRAALNAMRAVPGFDQVLKFFMGLTTEKRYRLLFMSASIKAGEKQFSRVHSLLGEAARILDSEYIPDVFIRQTPELNAFALGMDTPFIVLNSDLVRHFDDEELLSVLSHELAHILSGHVLYKTLLWEILQNSGLVYFLSKLPVGMLIFYGVLLAMLEWDRKSELSSDRAALLVVQDPRIQYRTLMKLAGGVQSDQMDIDEFMKQAEEYDEYGNLLDSVFKTMNLLFQTHPFPVLRVSELRHWDESGAYANVLDGNYLRRDGSEDADIKKDFEDAYKQYQDDLKRSKDPLAKTLSNLGDNFQEGVENATKQAEEFFRNIFNKKD